MGKLRDLLLGAERLSASDLPEESLVGERWLGETRRCIEPELVPWPGHYGVDSDGVLDPSCRLQWVADNSPDGGYWAVA